MLLKIHFINKPGLLAAGLSDLQLEQIVQSTMMAHDKDGDGQLSPAEFKTLLSAADLDNRINIVF